MLESLLNIKKAYPPGRFRNTVFQIDVSWKETIASYNTMQV